MLEVKKTHVLIVLDPYTPLPAVAVVAGTAAISRCCFENGLQRLWSKNGFCVMTLPYA